MDLLIYILIRVFILFNSVSHVSEVLKPKILPMTVKVAALAVNSNLVV